MNIIGAAKAIYKAVKVFSKTHAGEMLIGMAIAGATGAVAKAICDTPKAEKKLEKAREEKAKEISEKQGTEVAAEDVKLTVVESVKATWKVFLPTFLILATSIACSIGSASAYHKKYVALSTAYAAAEGIANGFSTYQAAVEKVLKPEQKEELKKAIQEEKQHAPEATMCKTEYIVDTGLGKDLCKDPTSGRKFYSNATIIERAMNNINKKLHSGMCNEATLNDFYDEVGLERTDIGDYFGWQAYDGRFPELTADSELGNDGTPIYVIGFSIEPRYLKRA